LLEVTDERHPQPTGASTRRHLGASVARLLAWSERQNAVVGPGAQFGEDRILAEIFSDRAVGYCAEIGAYDGQTGSATLAFERRGWHCLLVEPIPECVEEIRRHRKSVVRQCAASSAEGETTFFLATHVEQMSTLEPDRAHHRWVADLGGEIREIRVTTARIDTLLEDAGFPELQFITLDVEGHELEALRGFSLARWAPRIVIIEDNRLRRSSPVRSHMAAQGYVNFRRTGVNDWYARSDDGELVDRAALAKFERERRILIARDALVRLRGASGKLGARLRGAR
jgi:FkbM family methyltransferase